MYFEVETLRRIRRAAAPHLDGAAGVGRRAGRRRRGEAQPRGLRALEGGQARRAGVGLAVGPGRPGWHIECSAMSLDLLGEGFDIHGGGDDLVFPHHENELAQAEGAGHTFARHWIHNGHGDVGGEKMSKSLGNFTTLDEALADFDARAFRLAMLQTHYRRAADLGPAELDAPRPRRSSGSTRWSGAPTPRGPPRARPPMPRRLTGSGPRWTTTSTPRPRWRWSSRRARDANRRIDEGDDDRAGTAGRRGARAAGALGLELDDDAARPRTTTRRSTRWCAARDEARAATRLRRGRPDPRRARGTRHQARGHAQRHHLAPMSGRGHRDAARPSGRAQAGAA